MCPRNGYDSSNIGINFGGTKVGEKGSKNRGKSEKGKKRKRIRPNGPKIRNLQVEISLSPNFGASLPLIDTISVPSKSYIFKSFFRV